LKAIEYRDTTIDLLCSVIFQERISENEEVLETFFNDMYINGIAICGVDGKFMINDFNHHYIDWQSVYTMEFIVNADISVAADVEDVVKYIKEHIEEINDNNYVLSSVRNMIVFSVVE